MKTINFKFLWLLFASGGFLLNSCTKEIEYTSLETSDLKASVQKTGNIILSPKETLGKHIFFDKISSPKWMECSTCHAPSFGYTGPIAGININSAGVYRGADPHRFGNRKPPSAAYATFSPIFHYDEEEGLFIGGNFSDGRATGERLGNPVAEKLWAHF